MLKAEVIMDVVDVQQAINCRKGRAVHALNGAYRYIRKEAVW